jgi:restriction system protein
MLKFDLQDVRAPMVKQVEFEKWELIPGADGHRRSADPFGLVGNGITEEQLRASDWQSLISDFAADAHKKGWTRREAREVLLREVAATYTTAIAGYEIVLQAEILTRNSKTEDGEIVRVMMLPWLAIYEAIEKDAKFMEHYARHPREFEEFLAGAYDAAGWHEVILTPRRGDGGRDVIATMRGFGSVRFLDQAKAYSPGKLVTHDDVRAMLGVLSGDTNASKALVTTTSDFAPGIYTAPEIQRFVPNRLELKNGKQLKAWLAEVAKEKHRK